MTSLWTPLDLAWLLQVRSTVIDMVLATDLSVHFELVSKFKSKVGSKWFDGPLDDKAVSLVLQMTLKVRTQQTCRVLIQVRLSTELASEHRVHSYCQSMGTSCRVRARLRVG